MSLSWAERFKMMNCHCCKEYAEFRVLAGGVSRARLCPVHEREFSRWLRDTKEWRDYHIAYATTMQAIRVRHIPLKVAVEAGIAADKALQDAVWAWLDKNKKAEEKQAPAGGKDTYAPTGD